MLEENGFGLLVGKTITNVDVSDEEVLFVCDDESAFRVYHMQDCCESVYLYDTQGDPKDLIGQKIIESEEIFPDEAPDGCSEPDPSDYSWTWTVHRVKVASGKEVNFVWFGSSNGYYSESVYCTRTHIPL